MSGESPVVLNIARVLGPLIVGVAAIQGLLVLSREQLRLIGFRLFRRGHIVVVGLGDVGFGLATKLNELGARVIAIDRDAANPAMAGCKNRGISALVGDATDPGLLRAACVHRARHLIVAPGVDGVAVDVVAAATAIAEGRHRDPLQVIAHIEDRALWQALQARTLSRGHDPDVHLELFNLYEAAGRLLLDTHPPFPERAASERRGPRVLIAADQAIAEVLVVNIARLWRNSRAHARARARITLAGPGSEAERARIDELYPALTEVAELDAWEIDLAAPALREDRRTAEAGAIYVAVGDEARGMATALTLAAAPGVARDVVLVVNDASLGAARVTEGGLAIFGILTLILNERFLVGGLRETLARAMHDSYVREQLARGGTAPAVAKPWDELDEDVKGSNRDFAADIPRKLAALGCVVVPAALADLDRSREVFAGRLDGRLEEFAGAEHERWMNDRLRSGWTYAPERDDAAKRHDCLIPYEDLSEAQKEKDRIAVRELPRMLSMAGFAIEPATRR